MIIEVDYFQHKDYILVPVEVGENIDKIQDKFNAWIYDKNNDHKYWIYRNGIKDGLLINTEGLVYWLNNHYLNNTQETVVKVESTPEIISKAEKRIWF
ncbi:hypothetical protein [Cytobacillus sp. IB215665]|uniref:hypothetical protein n=1 Tax=Cytobacillus sp. IB215665 TaxID=3097357 RepID=UPI002A114642|nr:hypothetical protein [Cytobacillus sp. IB215665]MDX8367312.1 hypothetical protein [Cytobacillus sp. IB215665]